MPSVGAVLARVVTSNNERIRRLDTGHANPRPLESLEWHRRLVNHFGEIRAEWDRFVDSHSRLPLLDDLLDEPQGATEPWRAGLLVASGRAVPALAGRFARTIELVLGVPGIRSALWSVLAPGAVLHEHSGPNAGVLRYHLGVVCSGDTGLRLGDCTVPYVEGQGVLFDDTEPHGAWNGGQEDRVTLFLELLRPLPPIAAVQNRAVQALVSKDARYRGAVARAAEWDALLNA